MKKTSLAVILLVTAATAMATLFSRFRNWDNLIEISPSIIIVKCVETKGPEMQMSTTEDVTKSKIEVISVLKGNTKPGLALLQSWCRPYLGQQFLIFANNYSDNQFYQGYNAIEEYRMVPLNRDFDIRQLKGKNLTDQIQLILTNRLTDLSGEISNDNEEKLRIGRFWNTNSESSSNEPPAFSLPSGKGSSF